MKKYVGITACPTGIAHTYMAAEKLEETAKETGNQIKVETQGSIGVENELTADDIREADAVVVAADTEVDLSRFDGKRVLVTGVQDGISRPAELLEQALTAPTRGGAGAAEPSDEPAAETDSGDRWNTAVSSRRTTPVRLQCQHHGHRRPAGRMRRAPAKPNRLARSRVEGTTYPTMARMHRLQPLSRVTYAIPSR